MGPTGCGKTTFVNEASGSNLVVGKNISSQTSEIETSPSFFVTLPGEPNGSQVILIDTPGFDDTTKSDLEILRSVANYLEKSYKDEKKLAGVIYMQRISDPRMGGTATRNVRMFRKLCGHTSMQSTIIATTFWGKVTTDEGNSRELDLRDGKFFGRALDNGAVMMRHDRRAESALEIISAILAKTPEALRIQKQLVDKRRVLPGTDAAQELYGAFKEQLQMFQEEMEDLREELQGRLDSLSVRKVKLNNHRISSKRQQ
ncbi:hypothetical protein CPB83DRAFT_918629 [Crepidotus variabilis]|uniref:G domain-containing protein n=1 Tax=Crepidotus variabilis TaxID=179855 RepID=A0A9P6ELI8_9AGAR|nr:hypothetical protein CPB83DRAFT_918629 [Crepidotus variabilis]